MALLDWLCQIVAWAVARLVKQRVKERTYAQNINMLLQKRKITEISFSKKKIV